MTNTEHTVSIEASPSWDIDYFTARCSCGWVHGQDSARWLTEMHAAFHLTAVGR